MKALELKSLYTKFTFFIPQQEEHENLEIGERLIYIDESGDEAHEEPAVVKNKDLEIENKDDLNYGLKIVRHATEHDMQLFYSYQDQAKQGFLEFKKLIKKYNLPMSAVDCSYSLKGDHAHFLFTSNTRIDFRELVKDLAAKIKKKIYLRQIGPRDRAKLTGGYGKCGQECCCKRFLHKLDGVNMESARVQGVVGKGSVKLMGCCGKLLCCINYETCFYKEQQEKFPDEGQKVQIKKTKKDVTVINCDYVKETVRVSGNDGKWETYELEELAFKKNKKANTGGTKEEEEKEKEVKSLED